MNIKTSAVIIATIAVASVNALRADPSATPARKDLDRVIQNTGNFDNAGGRGTAGHPDTSVRTTTTTVPVATHSGSSDTARGSGSAPTQHTDNSRPVLTKPTTHEKPVKKEPPSPVVSTGDKK